MNYKISEAVKVYGYFAVAIHKRMTENSLLQSAGADISLRTVAEFEDACRRLLGYQRYIHSRAYLFQEIADLYVQDKEETHG